jgi:RNA polymerase sigma-70 factor (ECF subfamily)
MQALYAAIEKLPPQCRTVIRCSFVEGKSVREIADEMQLAYQTVQNQKQRGIKLLRWTLLQHSQLSPVVVLLCLSLLQEQVGALSMN